MNADTTPHEAKCSSCSRPIDADDRWSIQAPVETADGLLCAPCYLGETLGETVDETLGETLGDGEEVHDDDQ